MGITASELLKAIRSARSDGGFALVLFARMASHAIDDLAGRYVPRATLRLTGVTPPEEAGDGQAVTVRGMGVNAPFAGMAVGGESLDGGRRDRPKAHGDRPRRMATDLVVRRPDGHHGRGPSLLDRPEARPEVPSGGRQGDRLWFDGTLDLEKTTGGLSKLLGLAGSIKGTIEMRDAARVVGVNLQAPLCGPIDLKLVTIDELTFRVGSHPDLQPVHEGVFGGPLCWHERVDPIRPGTELFAAPVGAGGRPRP